MNVRMRDLRAALPDVSAEGMRKAVSRQQKRGRLAGLSRGSEHWLIVPLQHWATGAPPLESWLHDYVAKTLGTPYYVSLLSAAETYGSSPYAVMSMQVMVSERRRAIVVGRHRVEFHTRTRIEEMPTRWHETPDGRFKVSTPELTALDIIQHGETLGGIGRVREVLRGLWPHCVENGVVQALDALQSVPLAQRLGTLMDMDGQNELAAAAEKWLAGRPLRLVALVGSGPNAKTSCSHMTNQRFKVLVSVGTEGANA